MTLQDVRCLARARPRTRASSEADFVTTLVTAARWHGPDGSTDRQFDGIDIGVSRARVCYQTRGAEWVSETIDIFRANGVENLCRDVMSKNLYKRHFRHMLIGYARVSAESPPLVHGCHSIEHRGAVTADLLGREVTVRGWKVRSENSTLRNTVRRASPIRTAMPVTAIHIGNG